MKDASDDVRRSRPSFDDPMNRELEMIKADCAPARTRECDRERDPSGEPWKISTSCTQSRARSPHGPQTHRHPFTNHTNTYVSNEADTGGGRELTKDHVDRWLNRHHTTKTRWHRWGGWRNVEGHASCMVWYHGPPASTPHSPPQSLRSLHPHLSVVETHGDIRTQANKRAHTGPVPPLASSERGWNTVQPCPCNQHTLNTP